MNRFVLFFLYSFLIITNVSSAQTTLDVRGAGRLFPIAVPKPCVAGSNKSSAHEAAKLFSDTIARDLTVSGFFEVLNPSSFIEDGSKCAPSSGFAYSDWSVIKAEGLAKAQVTFDGGRIKIQAYLHDVAKQSVVLGKEYSGQTQQIREIAHRFANEIMKFFTGIPGIFGSRIAFTSRIGRFKELFVMEMDGSNIQQLTNDRGLALSANWSADGKSIVYTAFRNRVPDIFMLDVASRKISQITQTQYLELSPEFLPDNSGIILSKTQGGESDIVSVDFTGRIINKLTGRNGSIEVSPTVSPITGELAFCSNRSGSPQIFVASPNGGNPKRISFVGSSYCTSPAWSPVQAKIAFVCLADRGFNIFTANSDGSQPMQLTSLGSNEDPSWSPDGRYLAFSTTAFGSGQKIAIMFSEDGTGVQQVSNGASDSQPAWHW